MTSPPSDVPGIPPDALKRIPEQWRQLLAVFEARRHDLTTTVLDWSTGILLCTRRSN